MAVNLTRLVVLFSVFCALTGTAGTLDIVGVKKWANIVGDRLANFFNNETGFNHLQKAYTKSQQEQLLSVAKKDGMKIVNTTKIYLQDVLQKKIKSIKNLAEKTAAVRKNYTFEFSLKVDDVKFFNSKDLGDFPLEIDPKFSPTIEINKNSSVVQIPTDVYMGGREILNTITWTKELNRYFKQNYKEDPSLLWQYFGSSDGVYRVYPGFKWPDQSNEDVFDNRRRGWYIQGSSSPKDIVLLLDLSGSMAGQKLSIVKLAAISLLETLQENDFVNIVAVYANEDSNDDNKVKAYMVCQVQKNGSVKVNIKQVESCSDRLLEATQQNKKYLQSFVPNIKARGIAAISRGFEKAIEVLKNSRENGYLNSSRCTQAIILFTDGIEAKEAEETSNLLKEKNGEKKIRVFTYLVGREKSATDEPLKEITNEYRGCSFRIKTLSDVREKVLEYITVLSRPLGFATADTGPDPSWTPIYLDKLGLGLMITLVAPVFNKTGNKGELLGVVGTDVPLPILEASIPGSEVGVNGYGFAINNNGFVLFHPDLDKKWVRKYCEPAKEAKFKKVKDPPNIALDELEYNATGAKTLMKQMINRKTGSETFNNRLISDRKHRISWSDEFHYFFGPIENTSFSAAVAIPKISLYSLNFDGARNFNDEFLKPSNKELVIVAPWNICNNTPAAAFNETPVYQTAYPTAQDIINDQDRAQHCVDQKLKNLFFDANITKEAAARFWNVKNPNKGIASVFVATHGGIMRWLNSSWDAPKLKRDYIKEEFYTQAAQFADKTEGAEQIVVFSAPYRKQNYKVEENETATITASSPVLIKKDGNIVVAAVAGMHITQNALSELILNLGCNDTDLGCNDTDECTMRLIDQDGFVVATNKDDGSEVGKFFGVMEGAVMRDLINRTLFEPLTFTSVQEKCNKQNNNGQSSSARALLNPLFALASYAQFWTQTVFWSLAQFNIYSFFSRGSVVMAEDGGQTENMIPCSKELNFYKAVWRKNTSGGSLPCANAVNCNSRVVYVAPVTKTNLRLVVVKTRSCRCNDGEQLTTTGKPLMSDSPTPRSVFYRVGPEPPCTDMKEEGKPRCALASLTSSHSITVVFLLIVALFSNNWR